MTDAATDGPADATAGIRTVIDLDVPPSDPSDAYLRLHLLSHRLIRPHGCNLTGVFGVLANVVWTDRGPCAVEDFERTRRRQRRDRDQPRGRLRRRGRLLRDRGHQAPAAAGGRLRQGRGAVRGVGPA